MKNILIVLMLFPAMNASAKGYGILGANFSAPTVVGKDSIFSPTAGEIIYDSIDETFYGRTHTNVWKELSGGGDQGAPTGSILTMATPGCPDGYMVANGAAVSRTAPETANLFDKIGTSHGQGDNATTFNLPDYRGRFLRGTAGGSANDPDRASRVAMNTGGNTGDSVGSVQVDTLQNITGSFEMLPNVGMGAMVTTGSFSQSTSGNTGIAGTGAAGNRYQMNFNAAATARTSSETRPKNAYVTFCIKL